MINKQRVQRIKNLIYAFVILIMFLPLIFMSILSIQMFGAIKDLNAKVENLNKVTASQAAQNQPAQSSPEAPDSGYVIEPEGQTSKTGGGDSSAADMNESETTDDDKDAQSLSENSDDGSNSLKLGYPAGESLGVSQPADGGNTLGGGAPIESDPDYLAAAGADSTVSGAAGNTSGTSGNAGSNRTGNPSTGFNDDIPDNTDNLNPSTGLD